MQQAVIRARVTMALLAAVLVLASCGTRKNNQLGVVLIEDEGEFKAVRLVELVAPDSTSNYVLAVPPGDAGLQGSMLVGARPGFLARGLIRFAAESFPDSGTVVDSAFVEVRVTDGFGATSPLRVLLHRVTGDWSQDNITATSFPAFEAPEAAMLDIPIVASVIDTFAVSVGALAQAWVDDPATNFGIALVPDSTADAEVEISTREAGPSVRLVLYTTVDGEVVSTGIGTSADGFLLETTPAYVTPIGTPPGRLVVARGLPSRFLLKFAFPDLGDRATVNRAELVLHVDGASSLTNGFQVGVQRVLAEPWSGETTEVNSLLYGLSTVAADADSVVLAMTGLADVIQVEGDHGLQVRALREGTDTDILRFHGMDTEVPGKEPHLRIWYTPGSGTEATP
ncbi:DNRLRE domain-containing protein [bacterium]|nr:DNRLRE domain-containing protein [bacterium]